VATKKSTPASSQTSPSSASDKLTLNRRQFASLAATGTAALSALATKPQQAAAQASSSSLERSPAAIASKQAALDLAEWSYFWLGVERAELARGTIVNGKQMYVEYMIPRQVRHPYPIVMIHGGGGQGTDWTGAPDGRPGWATFFAQEGFKVYVVDRPGHGRSPFHPETNGAFPQGAATYEQVGRQFTAPEKAERPYGPIAKFHNQWPGNGVEGDPTVDQIIPGQGGSFLPDLEATHNVWRQRLAELFDRIGPAMIMTHSMGGPNAWIAGDVRPNLVKGMIGVEPAGPPFGALKYGLAACKMTFDPPVNDASELKTVKVTPPADSGVDPYFIQEEPARKLKNLLNIPAVVITSEASYHRPYDAGSVAFLRQAGVKVDHVNLWEIGIKGNAHFMMMEKNNREVLQVIIDWIAKNVEKGVAVTQPKATETAINTSALGYFWVGNERRKMPYGTIVAGQMYVQYIIPRQIRHPYPIVLVHGGGGSMLHYMGLDGKAGWAHYYAQEGYAVYLVDRPGHGRVPYHPDALGPMSPMPTYQSVTVDFMRAANGPNKQWPGTGDVGDPLVDQFQAGQNAPPQDNAMAQKLWATRGAELLDKIGPAIIQVHSAGGPFGYLVANERPNLVKAIVNVEGGGAVFQGPNTWGLTTVPLVFDPPVNDPKQFKTKDVPASTTSPAYKLQADGEVHKLKNLQGIPMVYVVAEKSGRNGEGHVAFLKQAGCDAENLPLASKAILGNGHFMMLENNRKQVFDAIKGWVESKVKA
jgi:pimeloyl-ACP methyl ester carboxylesterase